MALMNILAHINNISHSSIRSKLRGIYPERLKNYLKPIREVLYGMTVHEMDLELKKERGNLDHLFCWLPLETS